MNPQDEQQQVLLQQMVQQMININQQMNQRFDGLTQRLDGLTQQVDGLTQQVNQQNLQLLQVMVSFQNWTIAEKNAMYKSINKQLGPEDPLHILMDDNGIRPPAFPATKRISLDLTVPQLNTLLEFYHLDLEGHRSEKLMRLGDSIGVSFLS